MSGDNERKIRDYFTSTLDYWHNLYDGTSFLSLHMAERKKIVLDLVSQYAKGNKIKILDMGCGTGILTKALLNQGHTVAALDCSRHMLEKLEESLKEATCDTFLGTYLRDVTDTSFSAESFDAIICIGVFQYQMNDADLLREIDRILKKGGFCVFTAPNLLRLNYLLDPYYYVRFFCRAAQRMLARTAKRNDCGPHAVSGEISGTHPYDKKYFIWQVRNAIRKQNLIIKEITGFGYGPLTFWNRQIVSDEISVKLSAKLDRLTKRSSWLKLFSNRWAVVVEKY
jgi:2-polyprenyl-3-methyl-5-hydroxy-6-metoxy-1,4-benzoquinol methylase